MKKGFTLIELIFVVLVIGLLAAVAVPRFLNLKAHAVIESMSYVLTTGISQAVEAAQNYMYLENNNTFTLKDILEIPDTRLYKNLKWHYTSTSTPDFYNPDGTYNLKDSSDYYINNKSKTVMRITLYKDKRIIQFKISCKALSKDKHPVLRELCIQKWGDEDIQEDIHF
jgi:prepilin-type N-terminal cleavage/methylation domain-containing protein